VTAQTWPSATRCGPRQAHQHAHHVAALVGGIFGCHIEYSEDSYWDTCPLSLMHRRSGLSAFFSAA
jgi:hypothetical protein